MEDLPVVKLGVLRCEKDEAGRDLARLPRPAELRLLSKFFHLLGRPRCRLKRSVDGPGGYRIHPDTLWQQVLSERLRERYNGTLGRRVID